MCVWIDISLERLLCFVESMLRYLDTVIEQGEDLQVIK